MFEILGTISVCAMLGIAAVTYYKKQAYKLGYQSGYEKAAALWPQYEAYEEAEVDHGRKLERNEWIAFSELQDKLVASGKAYRRSRKKETITIDMEHRTVASNQSIMVPTGIEIRNLIFKYHGDKVAFVSDSDHSGTVVDSSTKLTQPNASVSSVPVPKDTV